MTVLPETLLPHAAGLYEDAAPLFAQDPANDYAGAWLVDGVTFPVEDIAAVGVDPMILFDPLRCPASCLAWVSQHVGIDPRGLSEADLRLAIPTPEGLERGTIEAAQGAADRTLTAGHATILVNRTPAGPALGHWTIITPVAETPDQAATIRAVLRVSPSFYQYHFVLAAGLTIDALTGTIDSLNTPIDQL